MLSSFKSLPQQMDSELKGQAGLPVHSCFELKKSLGTAPCSESAFFFLLAPWSLNYWFSLHLPRSYWEDADNPGGEEAAAVPLAGRATGTEGSEWAEPSGKAGLLPVMRARGCTQQQLKGLISWPCASSILEADSVSLSPRSRCFK